jgi:hypothetical protein
LLHEKTTLEAQVAPAMAAIYNHPCLQSLNHTRSGIANAPAIYLASGFFNSSYHSAPAANLSESDRRFGPDYVMKSLNSAGFNVIFTRESVINEVEALVHSQLQAIAAKGVPSRGGKNNNNDVLGIPAGSSFAVAADDPESPHNALPLRGNATLGQLILRDIAALQPEQAALVDMMIGRASACFVSAHCPSSFSYMVQRMRQLDLGQVVRYPEITTKLFGPSEHFKQWGV